MELTSSEQLNADLTDGREEGLPPIRLFNAVLRRRRLVVGIILTVVCLIVVWTLISGRTYTSSATLMPEAEGERMSQLVGIAAQFGIQAPSGQSGTSPDFYADLLKSRKVMEAAVTTEYCHVREGESRCGDLTEIYDVGGESRQYRIENAIRRLREDVLTTVKPQAGTVHFSVTTDWADVSLSVALRLVRLVNDFNLERRQSQAATERRFLEDRSADARQELTAAEDSLKAFLENNRRYENSPQLRFEFERLQRRVSLQEQIVTSLSESFEQAKIEEVRNTPVVTVVDPPVEPAKPDERGLVLKSVLGLILGLFLGVAAALGMDFLDRSRFADPDGYRELSSILSQIRAELRALPSVISQRREG